MGIIANLLFGDNSDKTDYKQAAYDKYYKDITAATYDKMYGDMKDYLDQNYVGGSGKYKTDLMLGLENTAKNSLNAYNKSKNNYFGNGMIGAVLNPWAQVATGAADLAGMGLSGGKYNAWDKDKDPIGASRDVISDLGAVGETAFDLAGMGALGNAVKGGTKLMSNVGKTALRTGALGAGENAFSTVREQGRDTNLGDVALSAGIGGVIGGALGGGSQLFGNARAISSLSPSKAVGPYTGGTNPAVAKAKYANAANTLGVDLENLSEDALRTARNNSMKNIAKNVGYETAEGRTQRMATNNAYQELLDMLNGKTVAGVPVNTGPVNIPFSQRMQNLKAYAAGTPIAKFGQTTRNILKTPAGKIGAGVGGGLLLSKLLGGNGQQPQQQGLTDAELQELLNYYNGGY